MHEPSQLPASEGERLLQDLYGSADRATRFYNEQMVDVLTERMREFLAAQTLDDSLHRRRGRHALRVASVRRAGLRCADR